MNRLQRAIELAKLGRRGEARQLLVELVALEPRNEIAWLWLSDLVDGFDQQIVALQNALAVNPDNAPAQARLAQLRHKRAAWEQEQATRSVELLDEARALVRAGRLREARELLQAAVRQSPDDEMAWLMLSGLAASLDEQIDALARAEEANPANAETRARLDALQRMRADPLGAGAWYEEQGQFDLAAAAYRIALEQARTRPEQREARLRLEDARGRAATPGHWRTVSPTLTLARLVAGPVLLYGALVLIQGGLNPLHVSPWLCLAAPGVLLGSFLVTAPAAAPKHPWWRALVSVGGASEAVARQGLVWVGWLCLAGPYVLLLLLMLLRLLGQPLVPPPPPTSTPGPG